MENLALPLRLRIKREAGPEVVLMRISVTSTERKKIITRMKKPKSVRARRIRVQKLLMGILNN